MRFLILILLSSRLNCFRVIPAFGWTTFEWFNKPRQVIKRSCNAVQLLRLAYAIFIVHHSSPPFVKPLLRGLLLCRTHKDWHTPFSLLCATSARDGALSMPARQWCSPGSGCIGRYTAVRAVSHRTTHCRLYFRERRNYTLRNVCSYSCLVIVNLCNNHLLDIIHASVQLG